MVAWMPDSAASLVNDAVALETRILTLRAVGLSAEQADAWAESVKDAARRAPNRFAFVLDALYQRRLRELVCSEIKGPRADAL